MNHFESCASECLDVIVRFHDLARIFELRRAIFALVCQTYRPVSITLVTQRFSDADLACLKDDLSAVLDIDKTVSVAYANYAEPEPRDARACLLNLGIAKATGRYLAFLDHDDTIFSEAYANLIYELSGANCAIAFGGIAMKDIDVFGDALLVNKRRTFKAGNLIDLFYDNFCPIHSFVIDRQMVAKSDLRFDESLHMLEDYDFLLRLCSTYASSFRLVHDTVGDYYFKNDASNTLPGEIVMGSESAAEFNAIGSEIAERKRRYQLSEVVQRQLGVFSAARPLTIAKAIDQLGDSELSS